MAKSFTINIDGRGFEKAIDNKIKSFSKLKTLLAEQLYSDDEFKQIFQSYMRSVNGSLSKTKNKAGILTKIKRGFYFTITRGITSNKQKTVSFRIDHQFFKRGQDKIFHKLRNKRGRYRQAIGKLIFNVLDKGITAPYSTPSGKMNGSVDILTKSKAGAGTGPARNAPPILSFYQDGVRRCYRWRSQRGLKLLYRRPRKGLNFIEKGYNNLEKYVIKRNKEIEKTIDNQIKNM